MGSDAMILVFGCWSLSQLFTLLFHSHQRLISSSSLSAIRVISSVYTSEVVDISPGKLDSSLWLTQPSISHDALCMKLNKQGDNIQPWCTPVPICKQSVVPCPILTVASWPEYRFLKRQIRWSGIPISFRIFHSLLWSTQSKAYLRNQREAQHLVRLVWL